jgi:hypothetical protein
VPLRIKSLTLFLFIVFFIPCLYSAEESRIPWVIDDSYRGPYAKSFQQLRYEIPNILRQTVLNLSGRIGLRYQEGWRYPLVVGFVDASPFGMENILAYVQIFSTESGSIKQELKINLKAYEQDEFNLGKVLAHELVHAMMNDSLGAEASIKLPLWFHEGLAVWGAEQGEPMLKSYVYQYGSSVDSVILNGLEEHSNALDYAEDYLAFKYIYKKHGINSLHNFVAEVVKRQGGIPAALEYTCFETWEEFKQHVDEFSRKEIQEIGMYKGRPAEMPKPY